MSAYHHHQQQSVENASIHQYRVVVALVDLFISEQQRVSDEDEDGSQDERDKHLGVDVVPGTVQLPDVIFTCSADQFSLIKQSLIKGGVTHLNRQNMVMAMARATRESAYPTVYMVFT